MDNIERDAKRLIIDAPDSISFDEKKSHALCYVQNNIDGISKIPQKLPIHTDLIWYWIDMKNFLENLKELEL